MTDVIEGINVRGALVEAINQTAKLYVQAVEPVSDEDFDVLVQQAMRRFMLKVNGKDHPEKYLDQVIDLVFKRILEEKAQRVCDVELSGVVGKRIKEWAAQYLTAEEVPATVVASIQKVMKQADAASLAKGVESGRVQVYRMMRMGLSKDEIAKKLKITIPEVNSRLDSARKRVNRLKVELDAYTADLDD